jgi:hypothetical protein
MDECTSIKQCHCKSTKTIEQIINQYIIHSNYWIMFLNLYYDKIKQISLVFNDITIKFSQNVQTQVWKNNSQFYLKIPQSSCSFTIKFWIIWIFMLWKMHLPCPFCMLASNEFANLTIIIHICSMSITCVT